MCIMDELSDEDADRSMKVIVVRNRSQDTITALECGKDFADLLLGLLLLPVEVILGLISRAGLSSTVTIGISNLYSSLVDLDPSLLKFPGLNNTVLNSDLPSSLPFLCVNKSETSCLNADCTNATTFRNQICDDCEVVTRVESISSQSGMPEKAKSTHTPTESRKKPWFMNGDPSVQAQSVLPEQKEILFIQRKEGAGKSSPPDVGFVKNTTTFIVTEDLSILKSSMGTNLALLKGSEHKSFNDFETLEIPVQHEEVMLLVQAALTSATPLTDVFLSRFRELKNLQEQVLEASKRLNKMTKELQQAAEYMSQR